MSSFYTYSYLREGRKEALEKTGISWRQYNKVKVVLEN